ncbi:ThuA domain-containing protein [Leeuwenhoekiella marinoflava]|uniref:ThuA domain-containing protein n=1 Tax=Leeuwenhoekiella marinoflava TaxID=988 RepID=UPI003001F772
MKKIILFLTVLLFLTGCNSTKSAAKPTTKNVLVFTKTMGWRHQSIEKGVATLKEFGAEQGWKVMQSEDSLIMNNSNLKNIDLVVFLSTTGNILGYDQEEAFKKYIQNGGAFMGIHAATDTEFDWPWYGEFIGGYFESHPNNPNVREVGLTKAEPHVTTSMYPKTFKRTDEWYNYYNLSESIIPTLFLDETTYEGGTNGDYHPIAWYQDYDGGRMYYTGGGHTKKAYDDPIFRAHLKSVMRWLLE